MPPFEAAFDWPNIDWRRLPRDDETLLTPLKFRRGGPRVLPASVDRSQYGMMYLINDAHGNAFWERDDLTTTHGMENVTTVLVASNRGRVFSMFSNPHHRARLFRLGLRPDTAIGCAWRFLFAPNARVREAMQHEFATLADDDALKISISVRVGDEVFDATKDANTQLEPHRDVLECAEEIERFARSSPKQRVIWYFNSDSLRLRQLVREAYGDKVLTETKRRFLHGECKVSCGNDSSAHNETLVSAVGHIYAMSMCDFHICNRWSGFARFAAWASNRYRNIYNFPRDARSKCTATAYDHLEVSAADWTGI